MTHLLEPMSRKLAAKFRRRIIPLEKTGGSRRLFDPLPPGAGSKSTKSEATGRTPRRGCALGGGDSEEGEPMASFASDNVGRSFVDNGGPSLSTGVKGDIESSPVLRPAEVGDCLGTMIN